MSMQISVETSPRWTSTTFPINWFRAESRDRRPSNANIPGSSLASIWRTESSASGFT